MIINFKSSIQREADRFFKELFKEDFNIREVTKGAFTQARAKLDPAAFKRLNQIAVDTFYAKAPFIKWKGKRLLAVDGTRLMLPNHLSIVETFGTHQFGPKADAPRSMAMGSILYDPLNQIALDSQMAPYNASERDLLEKHLAYMQAGDVLLLDRGYPCFWLLFLLKAKQIDFCVRLKDNWWLKVNDFVSSSDTERIVRFKLPKKDYGKLKDYPHFQTKEIACRLVKVSLTDGKTEVLCTSLIDTALYPQQDFKQLYHYRWAEEEAYKLLKTRIELEQFSGKTALAVQQDFHAKVFLLTLTAAFAHPIAEKVKKEFKADETRQYDQQINRTNAIATTSDVFIGLFLRKIPQKALKAFDEIVYKTREIIRPNRTEPRKHKQKKPYSMNYKPL
jgi:hypothetical protein